MAAYPNSSTQRESIKLLIHTSDDQSLVGEIREFVLANTPSTSTKAAEAPPVLANGFDLQSWRRSAFCAATHAGIDFKDASMSGTMRWPNSHVFQWLEVPSQSVFLGFESWEIAGWKQYLSSRHMSEPAENESWTLSKAGSFPDAAGIERCDVDTVRSLLTAYAPRKADLVNGISSASSTTSADSETVAAAARQIQTLKVPTGEVRYSVSLLDGLSLPLTIAHGVRSIGWRAVCRSASTPAQAHTPTSPAAVNVTVILAGASRRAEQRIAACTPYLRELALALRCARSPDGKPLPVGTISVLLVGPEVSPPCNGQGSSEALVWIPVPEYAVSARRGNGTDATPLELPEVRCMYVQDTLHGFMSQHWAGGTHGAASGPLAGATPANTLLVTVNPGYGNLFASLTNSWMPSLAAALRSRCVLIGLCANHDADALGECALLQRGFPGSVQELAAPQASPFASMSTWVGQAEDAQSTQAEERAVRLAKALGCSTVGDCKAYAGQAYWYAVRGGKTLHIAPEVAAAVMAAKA